MVTNTESDYRFCTPLPMAGHKPDWKAIAAETAQATAEVNVETGKLLALRYVDGWITSHLSKDNLKPAYIAGLQDIRGNVQAAIERINSGQSMESVSSFQ